MTGEVGALDAAAIAQVAEESWPVVRDADELHDALLTLVVLPPVPAWAQWFADLAGQRRAAASARRAHHGGGWRPSGCPPRVLLPGARPHPPLPTGRRGSAAASAPAWTERRRAPIWCAAGSNRAAPTTAAELASRLSVDR